MARKKRGRRAYATDVSNAQWALIAPMIPDAEPGGRPRKASTRELVDAILYFLRAGMAWRLLPHDLPPWQTVYDYLRRWQRKACGTGCITPLSWPTGSEPGGRPAPRLRSWIVSPSGPPIKRGIEGLRCRQEDQGPQASHLDRHRRAAARRGGPCGRHSGSGLSQRRSEALTRSLPFR